VNAFPQMTQIEPTLIHAEPIGEDQRVFLICEDQRAKHTIREL